MFWTNTNQKNGVFTITPDRVFTFDELVEQEIRKNIIDLNAIMISRKNLLETGGFDDQMPRLQDW